MKQNFAANLLGLDLAASVAAAAAASNSSSTACNRLADLYTELTLFPNSTNYTFQATNFWDKRSDLLPTCIFLPTDVDHIVSAVKIFHDEDAQFAIRGGGHMNVSLPRQVQYTLAQANPRPQVSRIQQH